MYVASLHFVRLALLLPCFKMIAQMLALMIKRDPIMGARMRNYKINLIEQAILLNVCWFHVIGALLGCLIHLVIDLVFHI